MVVFSAALLTGPRSVTTPFVVMILTLWAFVESPLSATTALRIAWVMATSDLVFDWSPGVMVAPWRSRTFLPELSAGGSAARVAGAQAVSAAPIIRAAASFFICVPPFSWAMVASVALPFRVPVTHLPSFQTRAQSKLHAEAKRRHLVRWHPDEKFASALLREAGTEVS